jgi:hypothetical protein
MLYHANNEKIMCTKPTNIIQLALASLMLTAVFSGTSLAQCTGGSTTVFSDNFGTDGDGTDCGSGTSNPDMSSQVGFDNLNGGGCPTPGDGNYSIVCDGASTVGCQWLWHDAFSDQTTGDVNGNMVIINDGSNDEFYRKTLTNLCPSKTYTVTFYLANLADADVTGACGGAPLVPNIEASAYAVGGTSGGTTTSYGNLNATSNLAWTSYTFSFSTASGQTSADIVLKDLAAGGCGNDIAFDGFKVTGVVNTATPVTLIDFNAGKESGIVKLKWSTATEINNNYFAIERSSDGVHFEQIGTVKGNGTSNEINYYTFEDYSFNSGIVYYRLKQVDFDDKYEYSKIRAVNIDSADPVIITNDPSSTQEELLISFYTKSKATFTIADMIGRVVYSGERVSDEPSISVNKSMLCCGFYIVKVQIGSELISKKIVLN